MTTIYGISDLSREVLASGTSSRMAGGVQGLVHWRNNFYCAEFGAISSNNNKAEVCSRNQCYAFGDVALDNRQDIIALLKVDGDFEPHSDLSLSLELYLKYGQSFVEKLRGVFAIAVWNDREKKLLLATDPLGIKPLYYAVEKERLLFSNRLSTLLLGLENKPKINYSMLKDYLLYDFSRGVTQTFYAGVNRLAAGHLLSLNNRTPELKSYYQLTPVQGLTKRKDDDLVEEYRHLLDRALGACTNSNKSTAILLSGGIDSSLLAACIEEQVASKELNLVSKLYAACCYSKKYVGEDETYYQKKVLEDCKNIEAVWIDYQDNWILKGIGDSSFKSEIQPEVHPQGTYMRQVFSRLAQEGIQIAISGAAADFILGGNQGYSLPRLIWEQPWQRWPAEAIECLKANSMPKIIAEAFIRPVLSKCRAQFIFDARWRHLSRKRAPWVCSNWSQIENSQSYLSPHPRGLELGLGPAAELGYNFLLSGWAAQWHAQNYEDSLRHGVSYRLAYLNLDIVEFALGLPNRMRFYKGEAKRISRLAATKMLNPEICARPGSVGMFESVDRGLKEKELSGLKRIFSNSLLSSYSMIDVQKLENYWRDYLNGESQDYQLLCMTFLAEQWLRNYQLDESLRNSTKVSNG